MRRWVLWAAALTIVAASVASAGPLNGPFVRRQLEVGAGRPGASGEIVPGRTSLTADFRGGERACVVAVGDHRPVCEMGLVVYDEKGTKVAEDVGARDAPDYVAVIWYPPRDGKYRIEVQSKGPDINLIFVSVR